MNTMDSRPFLLSPACKDYLWGGRRLIDDFGKSFDHTPLAETWECSTHPDGQSTVRGGQFDGMPLGDVLRSHPEYLGTNHRDCEGSLPILVKLIDARRDLSVQVHPDDDYAKLNENGSLGKTEMWYVLDASPEARLIYGFNRDIDRETLKASLKNGTVEKYLQKLKVARDDVFFIEAGTVHAIGSGALVAEVQQASNLTYRLYDYNRLDKNGQPRSLHMEKALDVARLSCGDNPRQPLRALKYRPGCASELLCRCGYFQVERLLLNTENCREMVTMRAGSTSFHVLLCVEGCGTIFEQRGESIVFFKGDCIFVPADSEPMRLHGRAALLDISC